MNNWWEGLDSQSKKIVKIIGVLILTLVVYKLIKSPQRVGLYFYHYFALIFMFLMVLTVHEVSHGAMAYLLGDKTAARAGRLSLNPLKHLDLLGLLMLFMIKVGWAKPVPINASYLRRKKFGIPLVALAGPLSNFLFAFLILLFFDKVSINWGANPYLKETMIALTMAFRINIYLAIFNLIPIPPLDGSRIVAYFFPKKGRELMDSMESYGFIILLLLLWFGFLTPVINYLFSYTVKGYFWLLKWIGSSMPF